MSETARVPPEALDLPPFPTQVQQPIPLPTPVPAAPTRQQSTRMLERVLNGLAGQVSLRMAVSDLTRGEVAASSKLTEAQVRELQSGEARNITIEQLADLADALGGMPSIQLNFPPNTNAPRPPGFTQPKP